MRDELRRKGEEVRAALGFGTSELEDAVGFGRFQDELVFGAIWGRDGLSLRDRMLCTLAVLCALGREGEIGRYTAAALHLKLEPRVIVEAFAQAGLYGGFAATATALESAARVFSERGLAVEPESQSEATLAELGDRGEELQRALHADGATRGYASPGDPMTYELYSLATRFGYGDLWLRSGLSVRERMLCALSSFCVLGLESQVRKFAPAALRVGLSREEVREAMMQTAPYGGFPRALNALAWVSQALNSSKAST